MIKLSNIFIYVSVLILNLILTCSSLTVKYPAKVKIKEARSIEGGYDVEIEANGETRQLFLRLMENIWSDVAQGLHITSNENGEEILERENIPQDLKVYHDSGKGSILSVNDGEVNGFLDSDYAIKCEDGKHFTMKFDENIDDIDDYILAPDYISIINREQIFKEGINNLTKIPEVFPLMGKISDKLENTYTAEIVVIVDNTLADLIGEDSKIYEYLAIFWNSVNKRYESIQSLTISIRLVGTVIIRNASVEVFFRKFNESDDIVLGTESLYDLSFWVYERLTTLPDHDIIYVQTGKDIIKNENSTKAAGKSYTGGACRKYTSYLRSYSIAIGEDRKAFYQGVQTAAHEIGHNLGAMHDIKNDTGTSACSSEDGYIMSPISGQKNYYTFSNCSIDRFTKYFASGHAECLKTNTATIKPPGIFNSILLPGDILSMTEQCKYFTGDSKAVVNTEVDNEDSLCYNLECNFFKDGILWFMITNEAAADRSECPSGKRCWYGACAEAEIYLSPESCF